MNLNKALLIGRIVRDPELKTLLSGTSVVKFGLATNHKFKTKDGEQKETAQFHNCVAFARLAEIISTYVKKGQEIYVEGRIEYRSWDRKEGGKAYATEIIVESMQLGPKAGTGQAPEREEIPPGADDGDDGEIRPEDIPF